MTLIFVSFVAGVLTVAAPCILPLLPVVVGRSLTRPDGSKEDHWYRPLVIVGALGVSIITFTLLLKASTSLLGVPQQVWQTISASIIAVFGLYLLWPHGWEAFSAKLNLSGKSNQLLGTGTRQKGILGDIVVGFSLGPIFNSCSPTYLFIVALIIGGSASEGVLYLLSYTIGLTGTLLVISLLGQKAAVKLGWLANPNGLFKKVLGVLLILVAAGILFGLDKNLQEFVIDQGWYAPVSDVELQLRN